LEGGVTQEQANSLRKCIEELELEIAEVAKELMVDYNHPKPLVDGVKSLAVPSSSPATVP